jgi:cardiolipin synthase
MKFRFLPRNRVCESSHLSPDTFTSEDIERIFERRFSTAAKVELLWKGKESFKRIFDTVKNARQCLCLQFYLFRNDETGKELAGILKEKSRQGVSVYVLYDHFGSFGTPRKFWNDMRDSGIRIRVSRPFHWLSPLHYVHRDHRKLIVIDTQAAFTGGLNIANEYSGFHFRRKEKAWRDTGILLEGPIVSQMLMTFKKSWYAWGGDEFTVQGADDISDREVSGGIAAIPLFVDSGKGRRRMRRLLYYSINHARRSISLTTAYFTPSRRMVEALEEAVRCGVSVRLLVPDRGDVPAASYAGRAFFSRLLKAGVEIYTYTGEILHAKTFVFDECWSIIGSTNLDFQSLRYNDEGNVGILDTGFTARMSDIFANDVSHSNRLEKEQWNKRPFSEKVMERFFSLFRRRL